MRKTLLIFFFVCTACSCASEDESQTGSFPITIWDFLVSKPALVVYGVIGGITGSFVMGSRKKAHRKRASNNPSHPADPELESKYFNLEARLKKTEDENQQLKRQVAEAEQFSIATIRQKEKTIQTGPEQSSDPVHKPESRMHETTTVYYLQPGADKRFKEISKVNNITEALYRLTYRNDNPLEAELEFIDTPDNTFLAVQNEPTWILVACERSNIPTEHTTSIRTDIPGKAMLKNGEWEILQKVKITYV